MACQKNTRSSRINLNHGCNPCNPCDSCNRCACECQCDTPDYCEDGCLTIQPSDCSTYSGANIPCVGILKGDTMTEVIQKITNKLCECCSGSIPTCTPLIVTISAITSTSFRLNVSGLSVGDTFDVSLNNGATYPYMGNTGSFLDITSLTPNVAYIVKTRHNVTGAASCLTTTEVATTSENNPCIPLVVTFNSIGPTTARLNIVGLPVGTAYDVSLDNGATYDYTGETASYVDLTGLTPSTLYYVRVRKVLNSEQEECITNITFSTTPCPTMTFVSSPETGAYDELTGTVPVTITWNALPGALSYRLIDVDNLLDVILPNSTLTYTYPTIPGSTSIVTVYGELAWLGYCAQGSAQLTPETIEYCSTISNETVSSTTSNAYGPIFNIGWGCAGCTGMKVYYREFSVGSTFTLVGTYAASGTATLTPTISAPLKFNTLYEFKLLGTCDGANPPVEYIKAWEIGCSAFSVVGTPTTAGVNYSFTEFNSPGVEEYYVDLIGYDGVTVLPLGGSIVRTGTIAGTIPAGTYPLKLSAKVGGTIQECATVLSVTV